MQARTSPRSDTLASGMFSCNGTSIKDWSFFLSQILPLVNKSTGLVHQGMEKAEAVTSSVMATALEPDLGEMSASRPPLNSNHTSGMEHIFRYSYSEDDLLYTDYRTPPRDSHPPAQSRALPADGGPGGGGGGVRHRGSLGEGPGARIRWGALTTACCWLQLNSPLREPYRPKTKWVFGPRSANRRSKSDVSCITGNANEMSELPRVVETNYVTHNHSNCPGTLKLEDLVITIDESSHLPNEAYSGT
ncbi:hypothetical protein MHYP_G00087920 [Metynnis hypsauchen]